MKLFISKLQNKDILSYVRNFFKQKPLPLGRWNYENQDIKANLANLDNCGDRICGSPEILKQTYKLSNISFAKSNLDIDSK